MPKNNYENLTDLFSEADKKNPDKIAKGRADKYRGITSNIKAEEDFIKSSTDMKVVSKFLKTNQDDIEYRAAEEYAARQEALTGKRTLKGFKNTRGKHSVFSKVGGKESKRDKTMLNMVDNRRKTRDGEIAAFKEQASAPKEATATPAAATPAPVEAPAASPAPATEAPAAAAESEPATSSYSDDITAEEEAKYGFISNKEIPFFKKAKNNIDQVAKEMREGDFNPYYADMNHSQWFKTMCDENRDFRVSYEVFCRKRKWRTEEEDKELAAKEELEKQEKAKKDAEAAKNAPIDKNAAQAKMDDIGFKYKSIEKYNGESSSKSPAPKQEESRPSEEAIASYYDDMEAQMLAHMDDEYK